MEFSLKYPIDTSKNLFLKSQDLSDVAMTLEVEPGHLKYWLYQCPKRNDYKEYEIPKRSGGNRAICSPPNTIKILQNKFKTILDYIYKPKDCVYGFIKNRSIVDNARRHKSNAKWILNIDIKDFYPSISSKRVYGLFHSLGLGATASSIWTQIVTYKGCLPQGASTSPVISNMIAYQLDNLMLRMAKKYHIIYTRYADDITLSSTSDRYLPRIVDLDVVSAKSMDVTPKSRLLQIFEKSGFSLNPAKTRLYSRHVRREITGLTVNQFVNVRRTFIRQIRAMIHAAKVYGFENAGNEYLNRYATESKKLKITTASDFDPGYYFKQVIYGKLAFLRMVRGKTDKCYVRLCLKMNNIDNDPPAQIIEVKKMHEEFDVFICHASEDKENIAKPMHRELAKLKVLPFLDEDYIGWGDSLVEKINHALSRAKIVLVILSENSVGKKWQTREISSTIQMEIDGEVKLLPLLVGSDYQKRMILKEVPLLRDKLYKEWQDNPQDLAKQIHVILSKS